MGVLHICAGAINITPLDFIGKIIIILLQYRLGSYPPNKDFLKNIHNLNQILFSSIHFVFLYYFPCVVTSSLNENLCLIYSCWLMCGFQGYILRILSTCFWFNMCVYHSFDVYYQYYYYNKTIWIFFLHYPFLAHTRHTFQIGLKKFHHERLQSQRHRVSSTTFDSHSIITHTHTRTHIY